MTVLIAITGSYLVLLCVVSGLVYLLKPTFMPYHEKALGLSWPELSDGHKILHLGLMRVVGAGFLSVAMTTAILLWRALNHGDYWAALLAGTSCTLVFAVGLYANFIIAKKTGSPPPWPGTASGLVAALLLAAVSAGRLA